MVVSRVVLVVVLNTFVDLGFFSFLLMMKPKSGVVETKRNL